MEFHVTVMSLDSINEGSMVSHFYKIDDDDIGFNQNYYEMSIFLDNGIGDYQ